MRYAIDSAIFAAMKQRGIIMEVKVMVIEGR